MAERMEKKFGFQYMHFLRLLLNFSIAITLRLRKSTNVDKRKGKKKKSRFVDANLDRFTGFSRVGQPYFVPPQLSERLSYEELEDISLEMIALDYINIYFQQYVVKFISDKDFREAFCIFEGREEGVVLVDKVKDIVKILGMDPDPDRLEYLLTHVHRDENNLMKYKDYVGVILKLMHDDESEAGLRKAFKVFDESDNDTISVDSLRHVLTKFNDDDEFTEEEVQSIIKTSKPDADNSIHYEKIISTLCKKKRPKGKGAKN